MAEENKESHTKQSVELIIAVILAFIILTAVSQALHAKLRNAPPGTILYEINALLGGEKSTAQALFSIGSLVKTKAEAVLYDLPGGKILKSIAAGVKGIIVGGPQEYLGDRWWQIQFEDGVVGWLKESDLDLLSSGIEQKITTPLKTIYSSFRFVSTVISFILLTGIMYSAIRLFQIRKAESRRLRGSGIFGGSAQALEKAKEREGTKKWTVIVRHINSESESDWRLAVLEADILLDELVRSKGWQGDNLGERLKGIDRADFQTLDKAWEAHKYRNTIAHEGANFVVTEREAKRIIGLFEDVFKEFNYI